MGKNLKLNPSLPFPSWSGEGVYFPFGIHGMKIPSDHYFKAFMIMEKFSLHFVLKFVWFKYNVFLTYNARK